MSIFTSRELLFTRAHRGTYIFTQTSFSPLAVIFPAIHPCRDSATSGVGKIDMRSSKNLQSFRGTPDQLYQYSVHRQVPVCSYLACTSNDGGAKQVTVSRILHKSRREVE